MCEPLTAVTIVAPSYRHNVDGATFTGAYANLTLTAVPTPTDATTPITYTWDPVPDSGQGTAEVVYQFDETELGDNTITVTASNACSSGIVDTNTVKVFDLLARGYVWSAINDLADVVDIGHVYAYKRFELLRPDVNDLIKYTIGSDDMIRLWEVQLEFGTAAEDRMEFRDGDKAGILRKWTFVIYGYFGWNDADVSEQIAIAITKAVMNALDDSENLHDGTKFFNADPVQMTAFEPWSQWNEAVHRVTLQQTVSEYLT